jgi:hypothetical protein
MSTMEVWNMYTNLKRILAQAGYSIYKGFETFSTGNTKHFIVLLMFHGLAPSPYISHKFQSQEADPVNRNDFVHESFGKNAEKEI